MNLDYSVALKATVFNGVLERNSSAQAETCGQLKVLQPVALGGSDGAPS
jgi:hypothetical protein